MKHNFSKSKYCKAWQCPKILWLDCYEPQENQVELSVDSRMEMETEVGKLARDLFGDSVDVTVKNGENLCLLEMLERTRSEIVRGTEVICEASFSYEQCYCAVDILKKEKNGWAIYEVKSSTVNIKNMPQVYIADVAYQKYVLEHCGITVTGTYIVSINSDYVYDGTIKLKELFRITDVKDLVLEEVKNVQRNLEQWDETLESETEPEIDLGEYCRNPYQCSYWDKCSKHLPKPSVFDLYRMPFKKKLEYYIVSGFVDTFDEYSGQY